MIKPFGSLGLILAVALTIGASAASADTFTVTFACTSCADLPTAGNVTFPSPMIFEQWGSVQGQLGLLAGDNPGDTYTWVNSLGLDVDPELADFILSITDTTTGDSQFVVGTIGQGDPLFQGFTDTGTLTFTDITQTSPVPEPATGVSMLAGIGVLLVTRKLLA